MMYFTEKDFQCKCGCKRAEMMPSTIAKLIAARHMSKIPYYITSGFRCTAHNKAVEGKSDGAHTKGYAVDIDASTSPSRFTIVKHLIEAGFNRIGVGSDFIHADDDPSKPPNVMWTY